MTAWLARVTSGTATAADRKILDSLDAADVAAVTAGLGRTLPEVLAMLARAIDLIDGPTRVQTMPAASTHGMGMSASERREARAEAAFAADMLVIYRQPERVGRHLLHRMAAAADDGASREDLHQMARDALAALPNPSIDT